GGCMARRVEQSTLVQARDTRASAGSRYDGWGAGRLEEPRCLRTRLLLTHVPEVWEKAQRPRQVPWARITRRVTVRKALALFALDLNVSLRLSSAKACFMPVTVRQTYATRKPLISRAHTCVAALSLCETKAARQGTARGRLSFGPLLEQSQTLHCE